MLVTIIASVCTFIVAYFATRWVLDARAKKRKPPAPLHLLDITYGDCIEMAEWWVGRDVKAADVSGFEFLTELRLPDNLPKEDGVWWYTQVMFADHKLFGLLRAARGKIERREKEREKEDEQRARRFRGMSDGVIYTFIEDEIINAARSANNFDFELRQANVSLAYAELERRHPHKSDVIKRSHREMLESIPVSTSTETIVSFGGDYVRVVRR